MSLTVRWCALLLAALLAAGCEQSPQPGSTGKPDGAANGKPAAMRPVRPATGESLSKPAYLRDVLPATAYAYARIPSTWGVIGVPTGGALDKAVGSAPYAEAVRSIRQGVGATVIPDLPQELRWPVRLLLQHATSAIEAAVLASPDSGSPIPNLLVTATVDFTGTDALNAFLEQAAVQYPEIQLLAPLEANRTGVLSVLGVQTQVQLDLDASRLYLLSGAALQPADLSAARNTLQPNSTHRMRALENDIDASGQGLFLWVNPPRVLELADAIGQKEQVAMLALVGLTSVKSLGVGMGASGGIHRLKAALEMPQLGFRAFLPVVKDAPTFAAAGTPSVIGVLALPGPGDLVSIEAAAATLGSPEGMQAYREFKKAFAEKAGFGIEDLLASLGQDITFISDEAGQYVAVRIRDAQKFQSLIDTARRRFGVQYSKRAVAGYTYHHLIVPPTDSLAGEAVDDTPSKGKRGVERFFDVPSHIYWLEEGDYLIVASLPQVLMDRNYIPTRTPVNEWLENEQRMNADGALLLASVRNEGLPAFMYRMNLELLSYLGDVVERPVDMFALPTPREADLPRAGGFGVKVTSSDTRLEVELAFENNPLELLLAGSGYAGAAVAGIAAAIAVPAYRDYTIRAAVAEGVGATRAVRRYLANFVRRHGRFPGQREIAELDLSDLDTDRYRISINPGDGRIIVEYRHTALGDENLLVLNPRLTEDELSWECESAMAVKYLPRECRQ